MVNLTNAVAMIRSWTAPSTFVALRKNLARRNHLVSKKPVLPPAWIVLGTLISSRTMIAPRTMIASRILVFLRSFIVPGATAVLTGFLSVGGFETVSWAQMMLPGAMNGASAPDQVHRGGSSGPGEPKAPAKPIAVRAPAEDAILGHSLSFDGAKGVMQFDRTGSTVTLSKLTLPGERISKAGQACEIDIVAEHPIVAVEAGRPAGALRWTIGVEACPFNVDILDGAALVSSSRPSCDFPAADCRVSPIGLWGPAADTISPQKIKDLEHERVRAETTMRSNFRVLLRRAGKDKAAIKAIAGEQAAFSSEREMTCRDYAKETVHGFCSTQITQARSLAILAKFADQTEATKPEKRPATKKPRAPKAAKVEPPPAPAETEPAR